MPHLTYPLSRCLNHPTCAKVWKSPQTTVIFEAPDLIGFSMRTRSVRHSMLDTIVSAFGFTAFTFLSGILVARILGPEGRGYYGIFVTIASFGFLLCHMSFYDAAIIEKKAQAKTTQDILSTLLLFSLFITLITNGSMMILSHYHPTFFFLGETTILTLLIAFFAIDFFSKAFHTVESADLKFFTLNIDRVFAPFLFCIFCIALWIYGDATLHMILTTYVLSKIPVLLKRIFHFRADLFRKSKKTFLIKSLKLGLTLHLAAITVYLTGQTDRLLLISIWNPEMLGQYFVALSAAGAGFAIIAQSITTVALPALVGLGPDRHKMVAQFIRVTFIVSLAISLLTAMIVPILVPLVYGEDFELASQFCRGLSIALLPLPALILIQKINKSASRAFEIAAVSILVISAFMIFYVATKFSSPASLIWALGISKLVGVIFGVHRLRKFKDIENYSDIIPKIHDIVTITHTLKNYMTSFRSSG